jgi:hypothetical protein
LSENRQPNRDKPRAQQRPNAARAPEALAREPKPRGESKPPPKNKPKAKPTITLYEQRWSKIYSSMIERHQYLTLDWHVALTAVRLYAMRVGYDTLLAQLKRQGVAKVAVKCREEMMEREVFFARTLAKFPPDTQEEAEQAYAEIAEDLATLDGPDAGMIMLRFLDRLLQREKALNLGTAKTASPGGSPLPRAAS